MYRNRIILFTLITFISSVALNSQVDLPKSTPEQEGISTERLERLNAKMHELVDQGDLAGIQTAILRNGKLIHYDTYGLADMEDDVPLQENSIWRIYSMTKPIVSVGLMTLYEEGRFQLNDPVEKYIPEFKNLSVHIGGNESKPSEGKMKIIDLLRHSSGLGYGWGEGTYVDSLYNDAAKDWGMTDLSTFIKNLADIPLYFEPGRGWRYGVSTDVIGYLIEVLSGQSLDEFLDERILGPLRMVDTHFEVPSNKVERFISNYTLQEDGTLHKIDYAPTSRYTKEVTFLSGGGGLVSTSSDYLRFSQMLLNGGTLDGNRVLSRKTIELMTQDHSENINHHGGPLVLPGGGNTFGLGFAVVTDLARTANTGSEGSFGWGGAAGTFFRVDPQENLVYLLMIQLMPYDYLQARELFQTMVYQSIID